jgi:hypothetical protein
MNTIIFFEKEHRPLLQDIHQYIKSYFSISYSSLVHFAFQHSTIDHSLAHLYRQYN